jgi:hypothetical protein
MYEDEENGKMKNVENMKNLNVLINLFLNIHKKIRRQKDES